MIKRILTNLVILIILGGCTPGHLNYSNHPIIGTWKWDAGGCIETYIFTKNGIRKGTSYKETLKAEYKISVEPTSNGFYALYDKVIEESDGADCSGSTSNMTGDEINAFVYFKDVNTIFFCFSENSEDCFGPFVREILN